jgi:hypothetical protein
MKAVAPPTPTESLLAEIRDELKSRPQIQAKLD